MRMTDKTGHIDFSGIISVGSEKYAFGFVSMDNQPGKLLSFTRTPEGKIEITKKNIGLKLTDFCRIGQINSGFSWPVVQGRKLYFFNRKKWTCVDLDGNLTTEDCISARELPLPSEESLPVYLQNQQYFL